MPGISTGITFDANLMNLKLIDNSQVRSEVVDFLQTDEAIVQSFMTVRDQVIFTNKRIFVVNVQGITGKKVSYFSYPYSKVQYFGVETAGVMDIDSELSLAFTNGVVLQFDFKSHVDIKGICTMISKFIL